MAEWELRNRCIYAPIKRVYRILPLFDLKMGKMHRLRGYTPKIGVQILISTFKNRPQFWIADLSKCKIERFFNKKTSKMAFCAKSHFGPKNDLKSMILDPKMTQNDRFWPILDPKMTQNDRFWTPKWPFSGFSRFWTKKGYFTCKNGHFGLFLDPFLAILGSIFDPKIDLPEVLWLKSTILAPNRRDPSQTPIRTSKKGSKMGVQNGSKIGYRKTSIFRSKIDQKSTPKNGFPKMRFLTIFRFLLFIFFFVFCKKIDRNKKWWSGFVRKVELDHRNDLRRPLPGHFTSTLRKKMGLRRPLT